MLYIAARLYGFLHQVLLRKKGFAEVWNPQFSLEGFQKMALRITEQWVRERVKLNHDILGMISFVILRLLHIFTIFPWLTHALQVVASPVTLS